MRHKLVTAALSVVFLLAMVVAVAPGQVSSVVGQVIPTNYLAPTSGQIAAVGGAVTNPSGLIAQVASGKAWCNGGPTEVPQAQLVLQASTSFLIVYDCGSKHLYAKTAVTAPGSPTNQPGVPNTLLTPTGLEIPLATVVCGASTCATITDKRSPSQWAIGSSTGAHLNTPAASSDVAGTGTLSGGTLAITFAVPYQVAPVCVATDTTAANAMKTATSGGPPVTTLTVTGTSTDTFNYVCIGNPN